LEKHSDFCIAVDENVHNGIVVKLKKAGFSVILARECGLRGHTEKKKWIFLKAPSLLW